MGTEQIHQNEENSNVGYKRYGWKHVAIKIKENDLITLNRQLDRLGYETLGELVRDLMAEKIMHMTDDKQIDFMKTNLQANGQSTFQQGNYYDFYKSVEVDDLLKEYVKRYTSKTSRSLVS